MQEFTHLTVRYRCYSPIAFGKKHDPAGLYIKKWVPELAKMPQKYIYEPWTAPITIQQACGCIIGKGYPKPIVDHSIAVKANMGRMKAAYDAIKKAQGGPDDEDTDDDASETEDVKPKKSDTKPKITADKASKPVKVKAETQSEGQTKRPAITKEESE